MHNADAAYQQGHSCDQEQHQSEGIRRAVGYGDQLREILDNVIRFRPVPRLDYFANLIGYRNHQRRIGGREVKLPDGWRVGKIAAYAVRNHHGVIGDFRLPERIHALPERPYNGEGKSAQLDHFTDCLVHRPIKLFGQFLLHHADFVASLLVLGVEEPSGENHQIADGTVLWKNPEYANIALFAAANRNAFIQRDPRRSGHDSGYAFQNGVHVIDGQEIGSRVALRSTFILGIDHVGADRLNLVEHVLLPGHTDGDHKNEGSSTNDHSQGGERKAHLVAAERVIGETDNFPENQFRWTARRRGSSRHT